MVHGACRSALRALQNELRPGDRVAFLLPEPASTSDAWLHEIREAGFQNLRVTALGRSPFLLSQKLNLHLFRHEVPWAARSSFSLIIPTRNEAATIGSLIQRLTGLEGRETEIIFVEGHSTDDTWGAITRTLSHYHGPLRLRALRQPGHGKTDAVHWGLSKAEGKILGISDGNLSAPPETVRRLYEALVEGRGDLIYGDRFRLPMEPGAMGFASKLANRLSVAAVSAFLHQPVSDVWCGTKLLSAEDYKLISRWSARHFGRNALGDLELLLGAGALDLKLLPMPLSYRARVYGASRANPFKEAVSLVTALLRQSSRPRLRS